MMGSPDSYGLILSASLLLAIPAILAALASVFGARLAEQIRRTCLGAGSIAIITVVGVATIHKSGGHGANSLEPMDAVRFVANHPAPFVLTSATLVAIAILIRRPSGHDR